MLPPATAVSVDDLNLLREWRQPLTPRRLGMDVIGSIVVHVIVLGVILVFPEETRERKERPSPPDFKKAVHLVAPRFTEPTQKAPNQGKITRELDVRSMNPAPVRPAPQFRLPQPAPGPIASAPQPVPMPVIEQPKIQVAAASTPPPLTPSIQPLAQQPPQQQAQTAAAPPQPEKPKLAFESVSAQPIHVEAPNPIKIPIPSKSILPGAGGTIVGDTGDSTTTIPSNLPSPGRIGSNLQLLSDPRGVDFKPYLIQVLTAVRRNWLSIIPESARLGRRGRVLIQFAIDRTGGVPKLVIAEGAGTDALDRAAVAAISASYPFPPLPGEYNGDQIRVQLAFSYNLPTR